jgi:hypothetical protein
VAGAVAEAAIKTGEARKQVDPKAVASQLKHYLYDGVMATAKPV